MQIIGCFIGKIRLQHNYFLYAQQILCQILWESLTVNQRLFSETIVVLGARAGSSEVWVKCVNEIQMPLHSAELSLQYIYTQMKKGHNHFGLSCQQTNSLFMNDEYCILLSKLLLPLLHKLEDLIYTQLDIHFRGS